MCTVARNQASLQGAGNVCAPFPVQRTALMSSLDEILAGYAGLQADQEAFYKDLHQHPSCHIMSTAPPGGSPGNCGNTASRSRPGSAARD